MYRDVTSILLYVGASYLLILLAIASVEHPVNFVVTLHPFNRVVEMPAFVLPLLAFVVLLPLHLLAVVSSGRISPVMPVLFYVTLLVAAGAAYGQMSWAAAAVVVALASGAFAASWLFVLMLWRGETIELESRWGGLGGGLGGWRLSRAASLLLLSLSLIAGSVAAVVPHAPSALDRAEARKDGPQVPAKDARQVSTPQDASKTSSAK